MTAVRVGRLTLTAPDEELVRRGAILIEDAMRIATMPAAARHRVYIVRHLDIGVIAANTAPQTIALQIGRRLEHVRLTAVPATGPSAADARAVWFADEPAAIAELARRLVHGRPSGWFWPHVAAGAVKLPSLREALRACLLAAARTEAGPLAAAAVLDAIEAARDGAVLGAFTEAEALELLGALFGPGSLDGPPAAALGALTHLQPRWRARFLRWAPRWGADPRALWLAAIAAIASRGAIGDPGIALARARALVWEVLAGGAPAVPGDASAAPALPAGGPRPPPRIEILEAPRPGRAPDREAADPPAAGLPLDEAIATTAAAGALFLVRPRAMLGIAAWLDDHAWAAERNWGAHWIAALAAAHAGPDDPLALALGDGAITDGPFAAPASWRDLLGRRPCRLRPTAGGGRVLDGGRLPIAAWRDGHPGGLEAFRDRRVRRGPLAGDRPWAALAWERAAARWLRTYARLRLADVVRRTATISSTPTHLDLVLPLDAADARIRAAGLDVDPGWVPWLGRVIRFHYEEASR